MKGQKLKGNDDEILEDALEDSIFLRVIDFGLKRPDGFTFEDIMSGLSLQGWKRTIVQEYLNTAYQNAYNARIGRGVTGDTPFFVIKSGGSNYQDDSYKYTISFDAQFSYLDYQELKFARKNAKEARTLANRAINISLGALVVSIFMPILVALLLTQTVKLDEGQLQSLQSNTTR